MSNSSGNIDENNNSISLIDSFDTPYDKNKIPYKKMNYKYLLYKKRLNYGRNSLLGIVNQEMRLLPTLEIINDNNTNISNLVNSGLMNTNERSSCPQSPIDENFYNKLIYDCDLDFNVKESKREIRLKKILQEKLKKLLHLTNINS